MAISAIMSWLGRPMTLEAREPHFVTAAEPMPTMAEAARPYPARPPPTWTADRLATTDALWGDGYQFPGGEDETLRLAKPLGLSAASSLLLIGAGGGGPACSVATQFGAWVSGFEADPGLVAAANERVLHKNLAKRIQINLWKPDEPHFSPHFYHHGLALEPLHGSQPERVLSAIAAALKPSGHLMMVDLVADSPLDPTNPAVAAWARLERRDPRALPAEVTITRILGRLGFDVRIVEDVSQRHIHHAMIGWRTAVRIMEDAPPTRRAAMQTVEEAELWLIRLRLFQASRLRQVRWHAIGKG